MRDRKRNFKIKESVNASSFNLSIMHTSINAVMNSKKMSVRSLFVNLKLQHEINKILELFTNEITNIVIHSSSVRIGHGKLNRHRSINVKNENSKNLFLQRSVAKFLQRTMLHIFYLKTLSEHLSNRIAYPKTAINRYKYHSCLLL